MPDAWKTQAERVAELAHDRTARAYLLGRLCAGLDAAELADLVQAALTYRERFGAPGNDHRPTPAEVLTSRARFTDGVMDADRFGYGGTLYPAPDL